MPTSPSATAVPIRRRWLRFSLRGVLVAIAVIAVLLWIPIQRAKTQRRAVTDVERLGGTVDYDFSWNDQKEPPAPAWLRRVLGDDFFQTAYAVDLETGHARNNDLEVLHALPQLHFVGLSNCRDLTDEAISHLASLTHLAALDLRGTQLTDAGMVYLRDKTGMKVLFLHDT